MKNSDTLVTGKRDECFNTHQMTAMVCEEPGKFVPHEIPVRSPGEGELLVRVQGCGVCASNIPVFEGRPWFSYPLKPGAPGHEGWGIVESVGSGVTVFQTGDRVAFLSGNAFAQFETISAQTAVTLPSELDHVPFPGEPLGCAVNVLNRISLRQNQWVTVVGAGFMGVLLVKLLTLTGVKVIALSRRTYPLEMARRFGASEVIQMADHYKVIEQVKDIVGDDGCPTVIEATGHQWPLDLATEITATRGTLVIAGYHQDSPRSINMQQWNWKGLDVVNAHERDNEVYMNGIRRAVELVSGGQLDPTPLYTHVFPLSDINKAFKTMITHPENFMKALVTI